MSDIALPHATDAHAADDHHDHPAWLAHHFDDAEQQFDSGKLGMWLFLITEVLFFSGMFCAYSLYRSQHPEIFEFASEFLNEKLGAINTGVLLFSSLTMAWAVRAAQLSQHRLLIALLGATLGCAAVFLGVKAVEYSHKWDLGLLPAAYYVTQGVAEHQTSHWLEILCIPAAVLGIVFTIWYGYTLFSKNRVQREIAGPLLVAVISFFAGVGLGRYLESGESHGDAHAHTAAVDPVASMELAEGQAFPKDVVVDPNYAQVKNPEVNQKSMAGIFFGIYYCMTGVHAVHILGGMVVISWLIKKAAEHQFHSKYFGPVDNVGLYWHLVDFIWIYLFPLLYLIK